MGVIRQALFAPRDWAALLAALTASSTHAILSPIGKRLLPGHDGSLDSPIPDIAADGLPAGPSSAIVIGWRWLGGAKPGRRGTLTIPSCEQPNPSAFKLQAAVTEFAERSLAGLSSVDRRRKPLFPPPWWIASLLPMPPSRGPGGAGPADEASAARTSPNG